MLPLRLPSVVALLASLVASAAAQSIALNPPLKSDRDVTLFRTSPDGAWAVYEADLTLDGTLELVSADVRGDKRVRRLGVRPFDFVFSPDSRHVVFRSAAGLFSVAIHGRSPAVLLAAVVARGCWVAPGSTQVVFLADGLYRVPIDGSDAPTLIHADVPYRIHSSSIAFTPDGARVTYVTEGSIGFSSGCGHVYSARLDGSELPVRLNDTATRASIESFLPSPDSRRMLFRLGSLQTRGLALLSVPVDGSAPPVALTPPLVDGANLHWFFVDEWNPKFTHDGAHVVYSVDHPVVDRYELYNAPLDGSSPSVQISTPVSGSSYPYPRSFHLVPGRDQVVYGFRYDLSSPLEIFVVPVAGGVPARKLNEPLPPFGSVNGFVVSPDGASVAYSADLETDERLELYLVPLDGSAPTRKISDPTLPGSVGYFQFLPDTSGVVYEMWRREGTRAFYELYGVPLSGTFRSVRLDGPMVDGGSVTDDGYGPNPTGFARLALDGTRLVYRADQRRDDVFELFSVPLLGRALRQP
jgi:hypothetical protein